MSNGKEDRLQGRRFGPLPDAPLRVRGFGIAEVLEVAHLDCDPTNCEPGNLALLCPTCHRMHDLDLIPTETIMTMRDRPFEVRWAKLAKEGPKKAGATRRRSAATKRAAASRLAKGK